MSGISYDLSRIRAIVMDVDGVLSPSTIPMSEDGVPMRMANIKDGYALQLAVKRGYHMAIITGADCPALLKRYGSLGIRDIYLKASEKLPLLKQWMQDKGLEPAEVVFIGDDIPDLPALKYVGLSCCPSDAASEVISASTYVSKHKGGEGCVREVLEQVMRAQGTWLGDATAFGW